MDAHGDCKGPVVIVLGTSKNEGSSPETLTVLLSLLRTNSEETSCSKARFLLDESHRHYHDETLNKSPCDALNALPRDIKIENQSCLTVSLVLTIEMVSEGPWCPQNLCPCHLILPCQQR